MPFNASAFWKNNKTTSKRWSWFQKKSLSPPLIQLPELKRAVTCDKNSGCRLHEQRRSEFAYELHFFQTNVAAPSYPWPINFLRSSCFCCKKDSKNSAGLPASVERTWSTVNKCSSGFPLTNHLLQMDSSSWVLMSWHSSAKIEKWRLSWRPDKLSFNPIINRFNQHPSTEALVCTEH